VYSFSLLHLSNSLMSNSFARDDIISESAAWCDYWRLCAVYIFLWYNIYTRRFLCVISSVLT
jgi:hypothetical protein